MDICLLFGRRVRECRLKSNLSQEKLAELANLHRTYISSIERGMRSISLGNIQKLAEALAVQPYELFLFSEDGNHD